MDCTAANYKLRDGLSLHSHRELIECTSSSNKRVFSILVHYFDEVKRESVVEHYEFIECKVVNAEIYMWKFVNCLTKMEFYRIILYQIFLIVLII